MTWTHQPCPLCGVPLSASYHVQQYNLLRAHLAAIGAAPPLLPTIPRPWSSEARALIAQDGDVGMISVSAIGIMGNTRELHLSLDGSLPYVRTGEVQHLALSNTPYGSGTVVFAVHNACWAILVARVGNKMSKEDVASALFHQLYGALRPPPRLEFDLGLEYGLTEKERAQESQARADPLDIPSLSEIEAAVLPTSALFTRREQEFVRTALPSPFSKLSLELLHEVIPYLSATDLGALSQTCYSLHVVTKSVGNAYWRSRFMLGGEADFLLPDLSTPRDWRRLYFGLRQCLRKGAPALVERQRIRKTTEPIASLIELAAHLPSVPPGLVVGAMRSQPDSLRPGAFELGQGQDAYRLHPRFVRRLRGFHADLAGKTLRILSHRAFVPFHSGGFKLPRGQLGITKVNIGARQFISGLEYKVCSQTSQDTLGRHAGFPTGAEEWAEIPCDSRLAALEVAFRPEGLVGVRFVLSGEDSLPWLGQCDGEDIGRGACTLPAGEGQCGLLVGFDRFKIVALGPSVLTDGPDTTHLLQQDINRTSNHLEIERCLWTPHPPFYKGLNLGPLLPVENAAADASANVPGPLLNIDFGGRAGCLLGLLTRIVFCIAPAMPFVGVECYYQDGTTRSFGDTSSSEIVCQLSFLVDGATGERIERVDLVVRPGQVLGLQLSTNHGRSGSIGTIEHLDQQYIQSTKITLPPIPENEVVTGFFASRTVGRSPYGDESVYNRMGLQSQRPARRQQLKQPGPSSPLSNASVVTTTATDTSGRRWQYRIPPVTPQEGARRKSASIVRTHIGGCFDHAFHTHAPLTNVRRIRAGTGLADGLLRTERHISGLLFEYYDDTPSTIVGQWFGPLHLPTTTTLDVAPGEGIQAINVWKSAEDSPRWMRPVFHLSRIAGIQIETSHSRSVTFVAPGTDFQSDAVQERESSHRCKLETGRGEWSELTTLGWEITPGSISCALSIAGLQNAHAGFASRSSKTRRVVRPLGTFDLAGTCKEEERIRVKRWALVQGGHSVTEHSAIAMHHHSSEQPSLFLFLVLKPV
ncbi:hypothetical protein BJX62DRAFT_245610 [Aspergillus germanicus]